ncbi:hypothetical protein BU24DRAFT_462379 [Aaosphaeria arxii CBS 175.79]|uniref:Protein sip5 n=1 Tax=Aaosphaeria arxii CBS 175.79 TaxID=1450172 RepID=A0A6A5XSC1_9PLEO|nr:uncharacterized protein BU24DRAFT_462379 [Aaosphaeria arxii CBS 175.79]KAF2016198.1 hypothetical protein BU24DRAFT_462379 [Aaosphaeria arxii CBS 175.79]
MGNSQAKEAHAGSRNQGHVAGSRMPPVSPTGNAGGGSSHSRSHSGVYGSRSGRGSRPDLSFLGIGGSERERERDRDPATEPRRETKVEREARKLEKERALRAQERERSIREEGVDGGYLVTLGTYTGPEDFSKPVVRQLQIERRLAPFWKGINDHSDTWTEYQLVAVVNDLPLPAADEVPPEEPDRTNNLSPDWNPRGSNPNINNLTVPISGRSMSQNSDRSTSLSPSHPAFSLPSPTSPIAASGSSSPFFRGRAKTLAALTTGSRNSSQTDMTPQEIQLPKDPHVNGQRIEAFLYKNASECPICFLYYPPYLNKTRCCDQPICSECFVQIKRPDPHPPEHHGDEGESAPPADSQEDNQLVSEPAACPFCVQPEFGITYDPPPFRRGLAYASQSNKLASAASAMSSTTSLGSTALVSPGRRRATSLAANDSTVITTDRVRPDWAKKLADARAHALRRAAAATALHNAAYMMGNLQASDSRGFSLGRRRRTTLFGNDSAGSSGRGTPRLEGDASTSGAGAPGNEGQAGRADGQSDLTAGRQSSRRGTRLEDLEELMMMEAIRLSLAAEEERKRKEEKEAAKEYKKEEKRKAKEAKKAEKAARKTGFFPASSMEADSDAQVSSSVTPVGKGKGVDRSGGSVDFNPLSEPTSTLNSESPKDAPQKHLEQSRAQIQKETLESGKASPFEPFSEASSHRSALRQISNDSSSASSITDSVQDSFQQGGPVEASGSTYGQSPNASGVSLNETPEENNPDTEPMFNFRRLEDVIATDSKEGSDGPQFIENIADTTETAKTGSTNKSDPVLNGEGAEHTTTDTAVDPSPDKCGSHIESQPSEALEESVLTIRPAKASAEEDDAIEPVPQVEAVPNETTKGLDSKHVGDIHTVNSLGQQPIQ